MKICVYNVLVQGAHQHDVQEGQNVYRFYILIDMEYFIFSMKGKIYALHFKIEPWQLKYEMWRSIFLARSNLGLAPCGATAIENNRRAPSYKMYCIS